MFSSVIDGGVAHTLWHDDDGGDWTRPVAAPDAWDRCGAGQQLGSQARQVKACQLLTSIPGVGVITATAFVTAMGKPRQLPQVPLCRGLARPEHPAIAVRGSRR